MDRSARFFVSYRSQMQADMPNLDDSPKPPHTGALSIWTPYLISAVGGVVGSLMDGRDGRLMHMLGAYLPAIWYVGIQCRKRHPDGPIRGEIIFGVFLIGFAGLIAGMAVKSFM